MTTQTRDEALQERLAQHEADMMSGRAFTLHAMSAGSIIGYQPPRGHRYYAKALTLLAAGAAISDRQATLVAYILHSLPLHQTGGDSVRMMYQAAAEALRNGYFDTIRNASPEPGRRSDNEHEYNLNDRIVLAHTLAQAAACFLPTGSIIGWCLSDLTTRQRLESEARRVASAAA